MADRIVQLEDNEGNKVYPISAFDESAVLIDTTSPESTPFDISTMGSYSLEEVETPFTWIDGKTIYKKTVRIDNIPADSTWHEGPEFSGLKCPLKIYGFAYHGDYIHVPRTDNLNTVATVVFYFSPTDHKLYWKASEAQEYMYVTIEYTKE